MMSDNGKPTAEVAERAAQQATEAPTRPWLHPDALMPLDYLRGKKTLAAELAERGHASCYDFLGTDEMYPFLIWALKSRDNPSFGWEDALRTPFYEFEMGDDARPQIPPLERSGSGGSTPNGSGSTSKQPRRVPAPGSVSSSG